MVENNGPIFIVSWNKFIFHNELWKIVKLVNDECLTTKRKTLLISNENWKKNTHTGSVCLHLDWTFHFRSQQQSSDKFIFGHIEQFDWLKANYKKEKEQEEEGKETKRTILLTMIPLFAFTFNCKQWTFWFNICVLRLHWVRCTHIFCLSFLSIEKRSVKMKQRFGYYKAENGQQ